MLGFKPEALAKRFVVFVLWNAVTDSCTYGPVIQVSDIFINRGLLSIRKMDKVPKAWIRQLSGVMKG